MNPFDLPGPLFLAFYAAVILATLIVLAYWRTARERSQAGPVQLTDPYLIALLRGGRNEMVRVVAVSLLDRGLLEAAGSSVKTSDLGVKTRVRREVERKLLEHCLVPRPASSLEQGSGLDAELARQEAKLQRMGLLPDEGMRAARQWLFMMGAGVLVGVAATKIAIALSRGRTNIGFLIVLAAMGLALTHRALFPRMTAQGERKLDELRNLFEALSLRTAELKPGGATSELAMFAAVFGGSLLPRGVFPWTGTLFPRPAATGSSSSSSNSCSISACSSGSSMSDSSSSSSGSSGSGDSSSCGSSCGGGGGCGGGCGGCGS